MFLLASYVTRITRSNKYGTNMAESARNNGSKTATFPGKQETRGNSEEMVQQRRSRIKATHEEGYSQTAKAWWSAGW